MTMRVSFSLIAVVATVLSACSTSEPVLPSSDDPVAVHAFLTGPDAATELGEINSYDWPDEGAKPASYFDWIAAEAGSHDAALAARAGESAHVLATVLGDTRSDAAIAPKLVAVYGEALTPFQGAMVGFDVGTRAFGELGTPGDLSAARTVFAAIATNDESGARFVDSAYDRAQTIAADAAEAVCRDGTSTPAAPPAIRAAGSLSGLAASADPKLDERRHAIDDVVHSMAAACLAVAKDPPQGAITRFIDNGVLQSPEVAQKLDIGLEDYFQSQRDYLGAQGIDVTQFSKAYKIAIGE